MDGMTRYFQETVLQEVEALGPLINQNCVDISPMSDGKLYKEILRDGVKHPGADSISRPAEGCEVTVHYIGRLSNGSIFNRKDARDPFVFILGSGVVIKGLEIGIPTMVRGERCKLYLHCDYGYGSRGTGEEGIPGNSALIFEIELIDFKPEDLTSSKNGALTRYKIKQGRSKYLNPNEGACVTVNLKGEYQGTPFDERQVKFVLGEGFEHGIPYGVEKALFKFTEGEKSVLTLGPRYAFGSTGSSNFKVPPNATVKYQVELEHFDRAREAWQMEPLEKLEAAKKAKLKGTNFFKQERYYLASRQYKNIINFLKTEAMLEGEAEEQRKGLMLAAYLNQSLCHLKLNEPVVAKRYADEAIEIDGNNAKAYYRRGLANIGITEAFDAKQDFLKVLELEPDNKAVRQQIVLCDKLIKEHKDKEKQVYSRMFEKFAEVDKARELAELRKQPNGLDDLNEWKRSGNERMDMDVDDSSDSNPF